MRVRWYGQSAFELAGANGNVFIDPFAADVTSVAAAGGMRFEYPPIRGVQATTLLISHEHFDHNGASAITGCDSIIRSTAGTFDTPMGSIVAISAEHDDVAGTQRGAVSIYLLTIDEVRVCHLSDLGQPDLRDEQVAAIGDVDLLFVPVGGGYTIDGSTAAAITRRLAPTWVVPMHYNTAALDFLEPADEFLASFPDTAVQRLERSDFDIDALPRTGSPTTVVVPAPPAEA